MSTTTVGGRPATDRPPVAEEPGSVLALFRSLPGDLLRRGRHAIRTSPGRLAGMLVVVVVLSIVTGVVGALMVQQKRGKLSDIASRREPVAAAAHQLYRALADADAMTVASFLHGGQDPGKLYARYQQDIQHAGRALAVVSSDAGAGGESAHILRQITANLPVYTGLIERAYANQRQGFPVGAAYLHEAYLLMQNKLLVPASTLFKSQSERLAAEQDDANGFPYWTAAFVVLLLASLFFVQSYLRKRTNRAFNVGLVVASGAVIVGLLWGTAATVVCAVHASSARGDGSDPAAVLEQNELLAITGRAVETLSLVNRDPGSGYEKTFQQFRVSMLGPHGTGGLFGRAVDMVQGSGIADEVAAARRDTRSWMKVHRKITDLNRAGRFDQAVHLAVAKNDGSAGSLFNRVEDELGKAIDKARTVFATENSAASNALTGLEAGILVLAVIAAVGSAVGISQRLQEYR